MKPPFKPGSMVKLTKYHTSPYYDQPLLVIDVDRMDHTRTLYFCRCLVPTTSTIRTFDSEDLQEIHPCIQ